MKGYQITLAVVLVVLVAISSGLAGYTIGNAQGDPGRGRAHLGWRGGHEPTEFARGEAFEKFKELRQKNPERFKQMMEQRGGQIKERLAELKEKDPERYRELLEKHVEKLETILGKLKEELGQPPEK